MDPGVEQALLLLRRAGRMDLLNQEALRALRLARRAAQGVVAAILACSQPTSPAREVQVGGRGRIAGQGCGPKAVSGAGHNVIRAAGPRGRVRGYGHAHKGGVGALKARRVKIRKNGGTGSGGREANRTFENRSSGTVGTPGINEVSVEVSSREGSWGSGSPQDAEGQGAAQLNLESDSGSEKGGVGDLG
ncbi:hypothetical protein NDU88_005313 [Pleurodeles waltl]|uniref:Uncharacterized protein n=1 Tax=Pleurodeles waltl TaxID=8319 RepID=A0AAV7SLH0_PLEWA|nr:hypothetical protein NDU88_005313 [Pleurodeles waltl]